MLEFNNSGLIPPILASSWKKISAGTNHTCGLTTAGAHLCWGANSSYELTMSQNSVISKDFTPRSVVCSSPIGKPGDIFYNATQSVLQFCDGSQWVKIGP